MCAATSEASDDDDDGCCATIQRKSHETERLIESPKLDNRSVSPTIDKDIVSGS
jgi:hypothetical protein